MYIPKVKVKIAKQVIQVQKLVGLPPPALELLGHLFLGSEEPSLKLLRSSELQRTDSSPISNCRLLKSAIIILPNINCYINSLLWLRVRTHIIYIKIHETLHTAKLPVRLPIIILFFRCTCLRLHMQATLYE